MLLFKMMQRSPWYIPCRVHKTAYTIMAEGWPKSNVKSLDLYPAHSMKFKRPLPKCTWSGQCIRVTVTHSSLTIVVLVHLVLGSPLPFENLFKCLLTLRKTHQKNPPMQGHADII